MDEKGTNEMNEAQDLNENGYATSRMKDQIESTSHPMTPYKGMIASKQFYDTQPRNSLAETIDLCNAREGLVNQKPPLKAMAASLCGEATTLGWMEHHRTTSVDCQKLLFSSKLLRQKCNEVSSDARVKTENMRAVSTRRLDGRVRTILDAKEELLLEIGKAELELRMLREMQTRLQTALISLVLPEKNNSECIHIRLFRCGIDNTRDDVSTALNKENEVLETGRNLLTNLLTETEKEIHLLSEIKAMLEYDWSDKVEAMQIDHSSAKLHLKDFQAQFKPISAALNEGNSSPGEWQDLIEEHIATNKKEIWRSVRQRSVSDQALSEVGTDVLSSYESVDVALTNHVARIEKVLQKLMSDFAKVRAEIEGQEKNIKELRTALHAKESPLRVAQTRHYFRSQRPNIEKCLDDCHTSLMTENEELPKTIDSLRTKAEQSEETLEDLHRMREDLTKNIVSRQRTLSLETRCINIRNTKPTQSQLRGFT